MKDWKQIAEKDCKHFLDHPAQKIGNRLEKMIANISFIILLKVLKTDCKRDHSHCYQQFQPED